MSMFDAVHLANLPADIIRQIIQMEKPESIDQMRLVILFCYLIMKFRVIISTLRLDIQAFRGTLVVTSVIYSRMSLAACI